MIVWCGRCDTNPVELDDGPYAIRWLGYLANRPWCHPCLLWAICQWPRIGILVAVPHA